jgi:hypothetical protein
MKRIVPAIIPLPLRSFGSDSMIQLELRLFGPVNLWLLPQPLHLPRVDDCCKQLRCKRLSGPLPVLVSHLEVSTCCFEPCRRSVVEGGGSHTCRNGLALAGEQVRLRKLAVKYLTHKPNDLAEWCYVFTILCTYSSTQQPRFAWLKNGLKQCCSRRGPKKSPPSSYTGMNTKV